MKYRTLFILFFVLALLIYGGLAGLLIADKQARQRVEGWAADAGIMTASSPEPEKNKKQNTAQQDPDQNQDQPAPNNAEQEQDPVDPPDNTDPDDPNPTPEVLRKLDMFAAHPDDPELPDTLRGVSDARVRTMKPEDVDELLQGRAQIAAGFSPDKARHLFQIGRVALIHGKTKLAQTLLEQAAEAGSAPAHLYLAELHKDDPAKARTYLERAARLGFAPAKDKLESIERGGE